MSYYILPIFTFYASLLSTRAKPNVQILLAYALTLLFSLFCGFRWYSGADYGEYITLFHAVGDFDNFEYEDFRRQHGELGFKFLILLFKLISNESFFFFMLISIFSLFTKLVFFFKVSRFPVFCIAFYLCLYFFNAEFIQLRMGLGLALFSVAIYYLWSDNVKFFIVWLVLATLIHSVFFIGIFSLLIRLSYRNLLVLSFFSILSVFVFNVFDIMKVLVETYANIVNAHAIVKVYDYILNDAYGNSVSFLSMIPLRHLIEFVLVIVAYGFRDFDNHDKDVFFVKLFLVGFSLSTLLMNVEIIYVRVQLVFDIVEPIVIVLCATKLFNRISVVYILTSLVFIFSVYMSLMIDKSQDLFEYESWLNLLY